jgi:hypothetical protein
VPSRPISSTPGTSAYVLRTLAHADSQ